MTNLLINLLLTLLKSDTVQHLAIGLLDHLAATASHPLTQEGLTVVKHIVDGTVDVQIPHDAATAVTAAAAIAVDAINVHNGK